MFRFEKGKLIFVILVFLLIQFSILPYISIRGIEPDMFVILIFFCAFYLSAREFLPFVVMVGLAKDLLSNTFFGLETISLTISALLLSLVLPKVEREDYSVRLSGIFIFCLCYLLFFNIFRSLSKSSVCPLMLSLSKVFFIAVYTAFLAFPLLFILDRIFPKRSKQLDFFG